MEEIVRLVGVDALSAKDQLTMETARSIREDYLHQNAFEVDAYTSVQKQYALLRLVMGFNQVGVAMFESGASVREIFALPVREAIARAKYIPEDELDKVNKIYEELMSYAKRIPAGGEANV